MVRLIQFRHWLTLHCADWFCMQVFCLWNWHDFGPLVCESCGFANPAHRERLKDFFR